jgi:hypothetical protein
MEILFCNSHRAKISALNCPLRVSPNDLAFPSRSHCPSVQSSLLGLVPTMLFCQPDFPSLWQTPERNHLKGGKLILVHSFRSFSPWLAGSIEVGWAWGKADTLWQKSMAEEQSEIGGDEGQGVCLWATPSDILPPTKPHLPLCTIFQNCHHVLTTSRD